MSKIQSKFSQLLKRIADRDAEVHEYLSEVVKAQNLSGIVMMTLFQMLAERGVLDKEEIEARVEQNKKLALDEDGNCVIPLMSLLEKTGGQTDGNGGG